MNSLRHGYTNRTVRLTAGLIEKTYTGSDAHPRSEREFVCLRNLAGRIPLPRVIGLNSATRVLTLQEVLGSHGQDLMEAGHAAEVLRLLGSLLTQLQGIDPKAVPGITGNGDVIVHGDYGPQNILVNNGEISALLDWEFAHLGHPIEDLAWTEWIVRMHHPADNDSLPQFFDAALQKPPWAERQTAMVQRCTDLLRRVEKQGSAKAVALWRTRLVLTESWSD